MSEYIVQSDRIARMGDTIEAQRAVVDAAIVYVHAVHAAHHGPYSNQKKRAHRNLLEEVQAYEENQL